MHDGLVLLVALLVWYLPGLALMAALGVRSGVLLMGLAPHLVRVNADDQRAISWLAERIRPAQRVLNSPNDGSTYVYVERGVPVLHLTTLGMDGVPYSYRLLESFRSYPTDKQLRDVLVQYNVAWVYVDSPGAHDRLRRITRGLSGDRGFQPRSRPCRSGWTSRAGPRVHQRLGHHLRAGPRRAAGAVGPHGWGSVT